MTDRQTVPGYVGVHGGHAIAKHNDSHNGGRNEQLRVDAQPSEVQPDLLPKVLPVGVRGHRLDSEDSTAYHDSTLA